MQIVGVSGLIGSGKSTVARIIEERYGFRLVNFTDALKLEVMAKFRRTLEAHVHMAYPTAHTFRTTEETIHDLIYTKKDAVTRALLQEYGTEVRRGDDPDYWVKALFSSIALKDKIVIADMRFHNEYTAIMSSPDVEWGAVIKVVRYGLNRKSDHISEDMPTNKDYPWSAVIHNDSDLKKLEDAVQIMWETIYHPPGDLL